MISHMGEKIDDLVHRVADPENNRTSQIKMVAQGENENTSFFLTELPNRINVTRYYEGDFDFTGLKQIQRWVKQGRMPKLLYNWFWWYLEKNDIWNLPSTHGNSLIDFHYYISVSQGERYHEFSIMSPLSVDSRIHRKIPDIIRNMSYFALSKVKSIQPELDEISKEEREMYKESWIKLQAELSRNSNPVIYSSKVN